jgi:hypothetical protein
MTDFTRITGSLLLGAMMVAALLLLPLPGPAMGAAAAEPGSAAQLTEQRCTLCHGDYFYNGLRKTRLGWEITVWRMRISYDTQIQPGEHRKITAYLSRTYPASLGWRLLLWLPVLALAAGILMRWRFRRRRSAAND